MSEKGIYRGELIDISYAEGIKLEDIIQALLKVRREDTVSIRRDEGDMGELASVSFFVEWDGARTEVELGFAVKSDLSVVLTACSPDAKVYGVVVKVFIHEESSNEEVVNLLNGYTLGFEHVRGFVLPAVKEVQAHMIIHGHKVLMDAYV